MSNGMRNYFYFIFLGIVIVDIGIGSLGYEELRIVSKPLILASLVYYFRNSGRHLENTVYRGTTMALIFSLLGDVFLLFDGSSNAYFMLGLASFLLAHILYGMVFLRAWNAKPTTWVYVIAFALVIYGTLLFLQLHPHLGGLTYPVLIYVLAILFMAISALGRLPSTNRGSFILVFGGALFFVLSDSILAIHMFQSTVPYATLWIMGSYALAQFLIVIGVLRQEPVLET